MPYITQEKRKTLDSAIENLTNKIDLNNWQGDLNYCVTQIALNIVEKIKVNYANLNNAIGVFECIKLEFYRRLVSKYEDKKIEENGDVYKN